MIVSYTPAEESYVAQSIKPACISDNWVLSEEGIDRSSVMD